MLPSGVIHSSFFFFFDFFVLLFFFLFYAYNSHHYTHVFGVCVLKVCIVGSMLLIEIYFELNLLNILYLMLNCILYYNSYLKGAPKTVTRIERVCEFTWNLGRCWLVPVLTSVRSITISLGNVTNRLLLRTTRPPTVIASEVTFGLCCSVCKQCVVRQAAPVYESANCILLLSHTQAHTSARHI